MSEKNFDEYITAAKEQLGNEKNNPTLLLLLSELHSGITFFKKKAERLDEELNSAIADMKIIAGCIDYCCKICKHHLDNNNNCELSDFNCERCDVDCECRFCSDGALSRFEWRGVQK